MITECDSEECINIFYQLRSFLYQTVVAGQSEDNVQRDFGENEGDKNRILKSDPSPVEIMPLAALFTNVPRSLVVDIIPQTAFSFPTHPQSRSSKSCNDLSAKDPPPPQKNNTAQQAAAVFSIHHNQYIPIYFMH